MTVIFWRIDNFALVTQENVTVRDGKALYDGLFYEETLIYFYYT